MLSLALLLSMPIVALSGTVVRKPDIVLRAIYPRQSPDVCTYTCPAQNNNGSGLSFPDYGPDQVVCFYNDGTLCSYGYVRHRSVQLL